jgi:hypothetical protein
MATSIFGLVNILATASNLGVLLPFTWSSLLFVWSICWQQHVILEHCNHYVTTAIDGLVNILAAAGNPGALLLARDHRLVDIEQQQVTLEHKHQLQCQSYCWWGENAGNKIRERPRVALSELLLVLSTCWQQEATFKHNQQLCCQGSMLATSCIF